MSSLGLLLLVIAIIAALSLLFSLWQWRAIRKMQQRLHDLQLQVEEELVKAKTKGQADFTADLNKAEWEQKTAIAPQSSAEKYRYVAALAGQGIDAQGIATALQLAPAEVEQLLQLARLKHKA